LASRGERGLLRRREETQRDLPDGAAGAEAGDPRRDRLGPGHRRAEAGGAGRQRAAFAGALVPGHHALPAPARLHRAGLRARAGRWPHRGERRQDAGAEAGRTWLRLGARARRAGRGDGMSQPAPAPFVASLLDASLPASGIAWLDALRREHLAAFAAAGLPDTRMEAWKYTALRALGQRRYANGDAQAATRAIDPAAFALPGVDGPRAAAAGAGAAAGRRAAALRAVAPRAGAGRRLRAPQRRAGRRRRGAEGGGRREDRRAGAPRVPRRACRRRAGLASAPRDRAGRGRRAGAGG